MTLPHSPRDARLLQQVALLMTQGARLQQAGNRNGALLAYQQAVRLAPGNPAAYRALLEILLAAGDLANAQRVADAIPAGVYGLSDALRHLHARLLLRQDAPSAALDLLNSLSSGREVQPATLAYDIGECLLALGRYPEAVEAFAKAQSLGLSGAPLTFNAARAALHVGDFAAAERAYRELCQALPARVDLKYELAVLLLKTGRLNTGFRLYHHRWASGQIQFQQHAAGEIGLPEWDGRKPVQSLVVIREQGIGEQLVFSCLLPALALQVPRLAVSFEPRLGPLIARTWPGIELVSARESVESVRQRFDACLSAADMGMVVPDAAGWRHGYLQPDRVRAARLREKYQQMFPGKKLVGISWKSTKSSLGAAKSVELAAWQPLLARTDCHFVNLQYGDVSAEVAQVRENFGVDVYCDPEIDGLVDMDGLAAQIAALDLVITTSNSTAHAAAATGAPTWVLLPPSYGSLWYWGHEGDSCPWYPEALLFRAAVEGAWSSVIMRAAEALDGFAGARP